MVSAPVTVREPLANPGHAHTSNAVRDASTALGAERIVTRILNRGVFVARPTCAEVQEKYRIRRVLKPAALLLDRPAATAPVQVLAAMPAEGVVW